MLFSERLEPVAGPQGPVFARVPIWHPVAPVGANPGAKWVILGATPKVLPDPVLWGASGGVVVVFPVFPPRDLDHCRTLECFSAIPSPQRHFFSTSPFCEKS